MKTASDRSESSPPGDVWIRRNRAAGLSLAEVLISIALMALVILTVARGFFFASRQGVRTRDKAFAVQKCIQMMEELRGSISASDASSVGLLDAYDDGVFDPDVALAPNDPRFVLTTRRDILEPADPLSGNARRRYFRHVTVSPMPTEPLARRVHVRVYFTESRDPLAEVVSVLRTLGQQFAPTQVLDMYILAIENVPGWWVALPTMRPVFNGIINDLEVRNPGLDIRSHWITRMAFGRDPTYTPYVNRTTNLVSVSPPSAYFYIGMASWNSLYYNPAAIQGRIRTETGVAGGYSLADQYNHAVRYPEEVERYAALPEPKEPSLRMLLEDMNARPDRYRNALVVNLHGELLPIPPVRNFSDPAKDPAPAGHPNVRVVTHPEQIRYDAGDPVKFRVYSYVMNPDAWAPGAVLTDPLFVRIHAPLSAGVRVRKLSGDDVLDYAWADATPAEAAISVSATETTIQIFNSPLRHSTAPAGGGLPIGHRLYGLEYIPCLVSGAASFAEADRDLMDTSALPKNTARWVIAIDPGMFPVGVTAVDTWIGPSAAPGTPPVNRSRTYVWVGQSPPVTEQYQFLGDPRHMPYADVKSRHGYNWHFTSVNAASYPGFGEATDGWLGVEAAPAKLNLDVPRYLQLFRSAVLGTNALWTSITGHSVFYVGLGGELEAPTVHGEPWAAAGAEVVREMTGDLGGHQYTRLMARRDNSWWGLFWLGELYPDAVYPAWSDPSDAQFGNLPVGPGNFYRAPYTSFGFPYAPLKKTNVRGTAAFYNGNPTGTGNTYLNHRDQWTDQGLITATGTLVAGTFNFPLPTPISAPQPFRLDDSGSMALPQEWSHPEYAAQRTTLNTVENYFEADPGFDPVNFDASALIKSVAPAGTGYFVINGLHAQTNFGTNQIGKLAAVNLLRGFLRMGAPPAAPGQVTPVPLVTILQPTPTDEFRDPSMINVVWTSSWTRWNGQPYTEHYPPGYASLAPVTYHVKFWNGTGWRFAQDPAAPAEAGIRSPDPVFAVTGTTLPWNVSSLGEGSYTLRVEGFRDAHPLHYAYHERQIFIKR
jgi:type II secretory pathway pseudopilin PulG